MVKNVVAKNYRDALRTLSRKLRGNSESVLDHPTARGDHREGLFVDALRVRLGATFDAVKAEVIDSDGRSTGEYDAVIYDKRTGACVAAEDGRRVIRVESVVATVEIKSVLKTSHLEELFSLQNKEMLQLTRYYEPTAELQFARLGDPEGLQRDVNALRNGVNAMMHYETIPQVVSLVFAFSGLSSDTIGQHLQLPSIDAVCVLDKYAAAKRELGYSANPPQLEMWAEGEDALGALRRASLLAPSGVRETGSAPKRHAILFGETFRLRLCHWCCCQGQRPKLGTKRRLELDVPASVRERIQGRPLNHTTTASNWQSDGFRLGVPLRGQLRGLALPWLLA